MAASGVGSLFETPAASRCGKLCPEDERNHDSLGLARATRKNAATAGGGRRVEFHQAKLGNCSCDINYLPKPEHRGCT